MAIKEYDVIVAGAGTAGMVAALAAARTGARTCLVESTGYVGGTTFALGNVVSFHNNRMEPVVAGLPQEIVDSAIEAGGALQGGHIRNPGGMCGTVTLLDSEILRLISVEMMECAGVDILFHSVIADSVMRGNRVIGITILNKSGLEELRGSTIVDCTGDADVATKAGVPYEQDALEKSLSGTLVFRVAGVDSLSFVADLKRRPEKIILLEDAFLREVKGLDAVAVMNRDVQTIYDLPYIYIANLVRDYIPRSDWAEWGITNTDKSGWGALKPFGSRVHLSPSPIRSDIIYVNTTNVHFDATDGRQRSRAEIDAQRQVHVFLKVLRRYIPGFEECFLLAIMPTTSVRASRRIAGRYCITRDDVENGRRFSDSIARGCYPMSVQSETQANVRHHLYVKDGGDYDVPYRSLLPEAVDGLLVAGRCMSATREASGSTRCGAQCMAYGHAAGVAAALAARDGVLVGDLDPQILRRVLKEQGAIV